MILYIILGLIVVIALWFVTSYNSFIKLKNKIEEAYSTMDVYLKKRYDLIPNLVETVKGYASHEKQTLENVIKARNMALDANSIEDKVKRENVLSGALKSIFALSENYPVLKANANFNNLQSQLQTMESEIANSRKFYNAIVKEFNTKTESFPSNIIANMFNFNKKPLFEVSAPEERENIKVQF